MNEDERGWSEYRLMVEDYMNRQTVAMERVENALKGLEVRLAIIETKAGLWGAMAGTIAAAATSFIVAHFK